MALVVSLTKARDLGVQDTPETTGRTGPSPWTVQRHPQRNVRCRNNYKHTLSPTSQELGIQPKRLHKGWRRDTPDSAHISLPYDQRSPPSRRLGAQGDLGGRRLPQESHSATLRYTKSS